MSSDSLDAHSLAEAHLFLAVTPCRRCGGGPLTCDETERPDPEGDPRRIAMSARCAACPQIARFTFTLPEGTTAEAPDDLYAAINPGDEPSRIIDVGQWITLFRVILEAAGKEENKVESRRLGLEAAQCLEEALKFYTDNELPPADAVFCESTRQRIREHPQQFARQRLADMRAQLPTTTSMRHRVIRDTKAHPWWHFWR